jgi:hypothetical protein
VKLRLERTWLLPERTIGRLYVNDVFAAFSCEDRVRAPGVKVAAETAIPYGTWPVVASLSPKFGRVMPEILVPGWAGLRFHAGNTEADSAGCVLLGYSKDATGIAESRPAARYVEGLIMAALHSGDAVTLAVVNPSHELIVPQAA